MADEEFSLVMPFTVVESRGGPYDDEAYVCGWEAGVLFIRLQAAATRPLEAGDTHELCATVHTPNVAQLDLIAMSHGYTLEVVDDGNEWSHVTFRRHAPP